MLGRMIAAIVAGGSRALTGAQSQWIGCGPFSKQRIYFANHSSHLDFILLWSALPTELRRKTRPVAAADYWSRGVARKYLMQNVFHSVPVQRAPGQLIADPLGPMVRALDEGASLILFPEGTRGDGEELQTFKPGIYYLARSRPDVDLVPVWIENCYRVMPKGSILPVPLLCSVRFGSPTRLTDGEPQPVFLDRLKRAVEELGRA